MTREEPIRRTMLGPFLDHKRAMIGKFLEKGTQDIPSSVNIHDIFYMINYNTSMLQLATCTVPTCQVVHFIILRINSSAPGLVPGAEFNISLSHSLSELLTE